MKNIMRKLLVALLVIGFLFISLPPLSKGEDIQKESKDVLTLKKDNVTLKLQMMEMQLTSSPQYQALVKELREIEGKIKALEPKEVPKPDKKPEVKK